MGLAEQIGSICDLEDHLTIVTFDNGCDVAFYEGKEGPSFSILENKEPGNRYAFWPIDLNTGKHTEFPFKVRNSCEEYLTKEFSNEPSSHARVYNNLRKILKQAGLEQETERDWKGIGVSALCTLLLPATFWVGLRAKKAYQHALENDQAVGSGDAYGIPIGLTIGAPQALYHMLRCGNPTGNLYMEPSLGDRGVGVAYGGDLNKFKNFLLQLPLSGEILISGDRSEAIFKDHFFYQRRLTEKHRFEAVTSNPGKRVVFGVSQELDQRLSQSLQEYDGDLKTWHDFSEHLRDPQNLYDISTVYEAIRK